MSAAVEKAQVLSPYDGRVVGEAPWIEPTQAERLGSDAQLGFDAIRRVPVHERASALEQAADRIETEAERAAAVITGESGKPIRLARREVRRAVGVLRESARTARSVRGEVRVLDDSPLSQGKTALIRRFPLGPVLAITPSNAPLNLVAHKVGPALAAGTSILVKPHERTPLSALLLAEALSGTGLVPDHVVAVAPGGRELAAALVADRRFRVLSFTGSQIGWSLKAVDPTRHTVLELGGNAAVIVHHDADLDLAARSVAEGAFGNSGQSCVSPQRVLVHERVRAEFAERLVSAAEGLRHGDPMDPAVDVGPLPRSDLRRLEQMLAGARAAGARLLCGGSVEDPFLLPTVLADVPEAESAWSEEVFGPVVCLSSYASVEEAIRVANDSRFGLQAGVFTREADLVARLFEELEVGGLIVGDSSDSRVDSLPYGGWKLSGEGREGPEETFRHYTAPRTMTMVGG